jgi:dolichol-phosphate mannosyltransferase
MERTGAARQPEMQWVSPVALIVAVTATLITVGWNAQLSNGWHVTFVVVAGAGYVGMLAADQRWGGLSIGLVVSGMVATAVVALSQPAHFTGDLWSYAMYGRIVAVHHASPYTHLPAQFPHDPFLSQVGRSWRHTSSVYGPAFTALSALGAAFLGAAAHATRLFYQLLATGALAAAALIVWRRTRAPGAVAFLGLHPMVAMFVVSGARNDVLVGLAVVAGVVLVERGRPATGGAVAGLGALVKLTGVVGLVAMFVTTFVRGDRRSATRLAAGGAGIMILGYAAAGPAALFTPMQTAGALFSRGSAWKVLPQLGMTMPDAQLALAALAVLVVVVLARHARGPASDAAAASLTMLSLGAAWALPGYAVWGMPAAALDHRSRIAHISAASGLALLLTYEILRHPFTDGALLFNAALFLGPMAMIVLIIRLLRTRAARPAPRRIPMALPASPLTTQFTPGPVTRSLVVLPTLDEQPNIEKMLKRIRGAVPRAHILVVDDGSTDGTVELAERLAAAGEDIHVVRRTGPRGLGPAYRFGFSYALARGFDTVVEMDADLSHDPHDLPAIIEAVEHGADLAIGSRYVDGGMTIGWPAHREALSRAGGWYARHMLRSPVHDITSGYRAYRADLLRRIDLDSIESTGFGFQIEMTYRAAQVGAIITEVPIVFRERAAGTSKMSGAIVAEALMMVTRTGLRDRRHVTSRRPGEVAPIAMHEALR